MAARLEAPRPEIVDPGGTRGGDGLLEVRNVGRAEAEARDPELGGDAVSGGGRRQELGVARDERDGRLVEAVPVRVGCEDVESGQRGDRVPVAGDGEEADRVAAAAVPDMGDHLAQEVDERRLGAAAGVAGLAAAAARLAPVRLVPEDVVDAGLEGSVCPAAAEVAVFGPAEARRRQAPAVLCDLARVGVLRHEAALGLAPERPADPPRARLHLEPGAVRRCDDLRHRAAVMGEVVLGERMQHRRVAERGELVHVARRMPRDTDAEVGASGSHGARSLNRFGTSGKVVVLTS